MLCCAFFRAQKERARDLAENEPQPKVGIDKRSCLDCGKSGKLQQLIPTSESGYFKAGSSASAPGE